MDEMIKIWLIAMFDAEIKETDANISNNTLWAHGCDNPEDAENYTQTVCELEDYKRVLFRLRELTMKGELDV
jgi:hypothetical protein